MTDFSNPLTNLRTFRDIYVEERRREVRTALELRKTNGEGGLWGAKVREIQIIIEAIDKAIADEEALQPSIYESRGLAGA
ncbi:hypothetical protein [Mesorhizobium sp. J428]|uniref:hypothetical protein n=1 Tax=Mesorhizobium sp. J428 TaxID=2898440 RepID=UPI002151A647|nr:hypothetical protein [Mesorhizobium sp. J428]MCR5856582.1 hypothetical protein [Mesorhizobium sp. J428]